MMMFLLGTLFGMYVSMTFVFFFVQRIFAVDEVNNYAALQALVWPYYLGQLLFGDDDDGDG